MGKRRGGELGVNKKGTPLYSREDIREQYCINDKELQVLDRQSSKGLFGCFSNQGQAGFSPCTGNKSKKSILGSCIARTSSEEELAQQIQSSSKRPISPGLRGTTWNGQNRYYENRQDEEDGFDDQYFRRRPKSFCVPPPGPQARYLPQGSLPQGGPQPIGIPTTGSYSDPRVQMSLAGINDATEQQRMMAYGNHPLLRSAPYPSVGQGPPSGVVQPPPPSGYGYTLPQTAVYFPMGTYSAVQQGPQQTVLPEMSQQMNQPNTPDLLMHRRQAGTPEVSLDDRKQKHVSFDSSSLMRSQTVATMDETSFNRSAQMGPASAQQIHQTVLGNNSTPSKSFERLIDGRSTPDYEYFNQVLPPEIARQIMLERLKRNSMRTQATQTDVNAALRNRHSSHIPISPKTAQKAFMISEGVQTNGFNNGTTPLVVPTGYPIPPPPQSAATATSPILTSAPPVEYSSPAHLRSTATPPVQICQKTAYHFDNITHGHDLTTWSHATSIPQSQIYATSPRPPKSAAHKGDTPQPPHSSSRKKATRSMSQGDMLDSQEIQEALRTVQKERQMPQQHQHHRKAHIKDSPQRRRVQGASNQRHHHHHHVHQHKTNRLQKSHSDGELIDDEDAPSKDRAHYRSCKTMKIPPPRKDSQQQTVPCLPTSEEEVSDRDLPELAPICPPPEQTPLKAAPICPPPPVGPKQISDDLEADLGQKLSPLGSNSSLLDLIESNSGAEAATESQNTSSWATLERQKLTKAADQFMPEETVDQVLEDLGKNSLAEENSEDAEEHVKSYLEQPPLKDFPLERKITEDDDEGLDQSRKSSSSGSYSVTSALAGNNNNKYDQMSPQALLGQNETKSASSLASQNVATPTQDVQELKCEDVQDGESKPTPATIRKQELKLDLQKEPNAVTNFRAPIDISSSFSPDESASENSLLWQRLPMGTGDVQKKREAFEKQIRGISDETKPKILNGKVKTPSSGGVRKIVNEEKGVGSPLGGGLARSPAMHSGFRTEDWIVERTPVNTPGSDRVMVGMINLSDEEQSFRGSTEDLCKSSGATTPQGSVNSSSFAPSSLELTKTESQQNQNSHVVGEAPVICEDTAKESEKEEQQPPKPTEGVSGQTVKQASKEGDPQVPLMAPPAGFGDSPEHVAHKKIPGFHEAITDEVLPQEELLVAEDFAPAVLPTLHIAESFQSDDVVSATKKESYQQASNTELVTIAQKQVLQANTQDAPDDRKMSTSSSASRTSAHSGHRSRSRSRSKERLLSKLAHSGEIKISKEPDDDVHGTCIGAYDRSAWVFIGKLSSSKSDVSQPGPLTRSESIESTQSEREFKKKYQAITHRMVHRKSSAVMYSRILERTFECNKTVRVKRVRGEFGFRIHGSRPVVVSAIEPDTPAESSGLEVGDIILTINGVNVLDLPHTEVVKTAQAGIDELELGLARVQDQTCSDDPMDVALGRFDDSQMTLLSGYLWKLSRSFSPEAGHVAKWSRRFFVLRADSCLYFFKQENEHRPLGAILVSGCTVLEGLDAEDQQAGLGRNFSFRLIFSYLPVKKTCPHKVDLDTFYQNTSKILCLAAESKDELTQWLNAVEHCAQMQENSEDLWRNVSEQQQQISASLFPRADCRGYLLKLDGHSRTWKRRYCILADACLYLYVDQDSPAAYATLFLHGYRVQSTGTIGSSKRNVFELIPPEQGMKFFYFLAETETEKKRWLASLEYSMDRWMKLL